MHLPRALPRKRRNRSTSRLKKLRWDINRWSDFSSTTSIVRAATIPNRRAERVSNYDNLEVKPHPFTEGDTLNKMTDADLTAIISHGGPALNKSALMPPYGYTLSKTEIESLIAYIRLISDPPYRASGTIYAQN